MISSIKNSYSDQYEFLKSKLLEQNKDGNMEYMLGQRNDYLNLYYRGMSMAKIQVTGNEITCTMASFYIEGRSDLKSPMKLETFCQEDVFGYIKSQIEKHVYGDHDGKIRREKVCQQWIMNMNNSVNVPEWFFIDMEYVFDEKPYGRPDLIAIKRKPNKNGVYDVALVELKIGNTAYSGLDGTKYAANKEIFNQLKKDIYNESTEELRNMKYGSGLVSHMVDNFRFLNDPHNYQIQMRQELIHMLEVCSDLEMITADEPLSKIKDIEQLSIKPIVYILSYAYVPSIKDDVKKRTNLKSMKQSFYNHFYTSEYCLKNMINGNQIEDILILQSKFKAAIVDDSVTKIFCDQEIGKERYRFIFYFKDPDKADSPIWKCL